MNSLPPKLQAVAKQLIEDKVIEERVILKYKDQQGEEEQKGIKRSIVQYLKATKGNPDKWVSQHNVAKILGITQPTIWQWV